MRLKDIKTLKEVSREYGIHEQTLHSRLKNLIEEVDYRKPGKGQGIILWPTGVIKLVEGKEKIKEDHKNDR